MVASKVCSGTFVVLWPTGRLSGDTGREDITGAEVALSYKLDAADDIVESAGERDRTFVGPSRGGKETKDCDIIA